MGYNPDYAFLIQTIMRLDAEKGVEFAQLVANDPDIKVELSLVSIHFIYI